MRTSRWARQLHLRAAALLFVVALVAAACGGGDGGGAGAPQAPAAGEKKGGSIVLAAEQWPQCLNIITSCAQASWLGWVSWGYIFPRLMETDSKGNFVASDLLVEAPTEANGGLKIDEANKANPFTITFKLRPEAVWDDGTPITSEDVKFTWEAILKTTGTLATVGYEQITAVETTDPKTAVLRFKTIYSDWWDLFGGNSANGAVLKKAAFPGKVDLKDEMKDSYTFSGGPWKLESWSKQQSVLVRNDKYWNKDKIPLLDKVTFVPRQDQATELAALFTGEAQAAFPQPIPGITKQVARPGLKFQFGAGTTYEGLWMNHSKFPFNDKAVREAFVLAVDRQAVIDAIYKTDFPDLPVLNCAGWVPNVGQWCDNTDFADISYQPDKAKEILQGAGWTLGGDGIFAKGGKKLQIQYSTTAGNKPRENTQALLKEKAKAAGIELVIKNYEPTVLFENKLPRLDYELAEYAQVASPDPSITSIISCKQIPTEANKFSGQNSLAWCNEEATRLAEESDKALDPAKRAELLKQVGDLERQDLAWLPMFQKPLILIWSDAKLGGPIGEYATSSYSGFFNMYDWFLK